jgi:outer membrane biosynthesis protein TonB
MSSGRTSFDLAKGEEREFDSKALAGWSIGTGEFEWKIDSQKSVAEMALGDHLDEEEESFKRTLKRTGVAMAIFLIVAALFPKPEPELAPQVTRFLVKKPVHGAMTAAAQGDSSARDASQGNNKSAKSPRGSDKPAMTKKAEKAKKVALKKPESKKAVAKPQAPKAAPKKLAQGKPQPVARKVAPAPLDLSKTAAGKLLAAKSFRNAVSGMMKGGVSSVRVGRGNDASSELAALSRGGSALSETAGAARGGSVGARQVQVASIGGGQGLLGGKGVGYGRGSHALVNGQGKSFVSLDTSSSDVAEGLTKDQVGRVIHAHMSEIRYCYEAAMLRSPDVEGRLGVKFVINGAGVVKTTRVGESSLSDTKLDNCVIDRLARWKFPKPLGGVDVAVSYPFVFQTLGR